MNVLVIAGNTTQYTEYRRAWDNFCGIINMPRSVNFYMFCGVPLAHVHFDAIARVGSWYRRTAIARERLDLQHTHPEAIWLPLTNIPIRIFAMNWEDFGGYCQERGLSRTDNPDAIMVTPASRVMVSPENVMEVWPCCEWDMTPDYHLWHTARIRHGEEWRAQCASVHFRQGRDGRVWMSEAPDPEFVRQLEFDFIHDPYNESSPPLGVSDQGVEWPNWPRPTRGQASDIPVFVRQVVEGIENMGWQLVPGSTPIRTSTGVQVDVQQLPLSREMCGWPSWLTDDQYLFIMKHFGDNQIYMRRCFIRTMDLLRHGQRLGDIAIQGKPYLTCWYMWTCQCGIDVANCWASAYSYLYELCGSQTGA